MLLLSSLWFAPSSFPGDWVWVLGGAKRYMSPRLAIRELLLPGLLFGVSALFILQLATCRVLLVGQSLVGSVRGNQSSSMCIYCMKLYGGD